MSETLSFSIFTIELIASQYSPSELLKIVETDHVLASQGEWTTDNCDKLLYPFCKSTQASLRRGTGTSPLPWGYCQNSGRWASTKTILSYILLARRSEIDLVKRLGIRSRCMARKSMTNLMICYSAS
jgi:hypothetical protein